MEVTTCYKQLAKLTSVVILAMQYWELSSKTCRHLGPDEQEVYNSATQTMSVKVMGVYSSLLQTQINMIKDNAS